MAKESDPRWDARLGMLGANVRRLRTAHGWSQETLAHESGLHRTYIGQVERGHRNVALQNLYRLSDSLGVSIVELLDLSH